MCALSTIVVVVVVVVAAAADIVLLVLVLRFEKEGWVWWTRCVMTEGHGPYFVKCTVRNNGMVLVPDRWNNTVAQ